jgi:hypothetical protein
MPTSPQLDSSAGVTFDSGGPPFSQAIADHPGRVAFCLMCTYSDDPSTRYARFNGVDATLIYSTYASGIGKGLWVLFDPDVGTHNWTSDTTSGRGGMMAASFWNASKSYRAIQINGSSGGPLAGPWAYSAAVNELVIDPAFYWSGSSSGGSDFISPSETGQVEIRRVNGGSGSVFRAVAMSYKAGASSVSMGWNIDGSGGANSVQLALRTLSGGGAKWWFMQGVGERLDQILHPKLRLPELDTRQKLYGDLLKQGAVAI